MYTRLRKALDNRQDKGFTLIELLVVIIIIGILAAIAIPIFLHQRQKAVDASEKSDIRTVATNMETAFTDSQTYPASIAATTGSPVKLTVGTESVTLSPGNTVQVFDDASSATATDAKTYCIVVHNPNASQDMYWESDNGGLQPTGTTACPAADANQIVS